MRSCTLLKSDIICLQETFCDKDQSSPLIPGYICKLAGNGQGRGVAIYLKNHIAQGVVHTDYVINEFAQCIKLSFIDYDLITIYRSPSRINLINTQQLVGILSNLIKDDKPTIINGDFNYDYWKEQTTYYQ